MSEACSRPAGFTGTPPTTADIADLIGSVDLSKVSEYGDERGSARLVVVRRGVRGTSRGKGVRAGKGSVLAL